MGLSNYHKKRSQDKTPEPFGGVPSGKELKFVVQKHDASHLHYDFRLEMDGVLKSWAVPKGPSLDPDIKRLAMMVEDHPYDYKDFEGIIPKGQYGGGTVIVWDEGTYEAVEPVEGDLKKQEKNLLHQLYSGKLKIKLKGKKLKGEFALVKAYGRGENGWLLMKLDDNYATTDDITLKDKSVISKKTIAQMEKSPDRVYGKNIVKKDSTKKNDPSVSEEASHIVKSQLEADAPDKKSGLTKINTIIKNAPAEKFYDHVEPMLATLIDQPFDSDEWLYEIKWDGYRAVAFMNGKSVAFKSRNNKSFSEKFYPIQQELEKMKLKAVIDGEVVVLGKKGSADFGSLQNWRSEADGDLVYYVFDILWYDGKDLKDLPLTERKTVLEHILPKSDLILLSQDFHTSGIEFLEAAKKMGLEGIMAKRKDSQYHTKNRTKDWLKIKSNKRQEVVIGGFTLNDDSSKLFSSLLVGVYENKKLIYTGKVGTGFNAKMQKEMMELFKPLMTDKVPFSEEPDVNKPSRFRPNPPHATVTWLKPELIGEVSYTELTTDGVMRHPSFEGMRSDKKAAAVTLEKEKQTDDIVKQDQALVKPRNKTARKTLLNPSESTQVKKISQHELKFTNLNKVFWPDDKITKRDLINYYYQVAPYILPYLKGRPQSMNRFPNGIAEEGFYFKDITGKAPDWIERYRYMSDTDKKEKQYLVGSDEATLLYMANLACIEMNPWNSTIKNPDYPTYCIIDLDPDKNTFDQVIETALVTKQLLDDMGVPCYCKTSGSTGLHIYIPLGNKYTYEQSKEFARIIVKMVHDELPEITTIERQIADRNGKMYLDFLQNRPHATIASVYSVRPKPGATVSMPLHWDEVKKGLKMSDFTIFNALERLESTGDIFKSVLGKGIDMMKVLSKFQKE
ncbi:DNA ligase D [Chryseobacterium chendengshani]|uniref:DNA ligase D n=1 Tax=Chryseobacterium sp. LJ756 TaxID=2864113 RepID=UPI001C642443|nr:DNA ligase D [Chryseobacterium sp. LJ756]MBW7674190.1 DNA ligase D [Chryseobacterium sp. LJ756]